MLNHLIVFVFLFQLGVLGYWSWHLHVWLIFKGPLHRCLNWPKKVVGWAGDAGLYSTSADDDDAANRPRIKLLLAAIQMGTQFYLASRYH